MQRNLLCITKQRKSSLKTDHIYSYRKEVIKSSWYNYYKIHYFLAALLHCLPMRSVYWSGTNLSLQYSIPLLLAVTLIIVLLKVCNIQYSVYEKGAVYINYLLTPATVALAIPLYEQLQILKKNAIAIFTGIIAGTVAGLASVLGLSVLFGLTHRTICHTTSKVHYNRYRHGISEELGGIVTISVAVIVLTGIFGNIMAEYILKWFYYWIPLQRELPSALHPMRWEQLKQLKWAK